MEVVFPRIVLAEFNTHRVFSRNSASSRAIPIEKMIRAVDENPYVPSTWGMNQAGMQAYCQLDQDAAIQCEKEWLYARDRAVNSVLKLKELGLHKQTANRLLEPFMWHTVIVTATEWSNFFNLRTHSAAHPDINRVAVLMEKALHESVPSSLEYEQFHTPYIYEEDGIPINEERVRIQVSVGRCARVSYLTHDGKRDLSKDIELHDSLLSSGHMSPFEHVARPAYSDERFPRLTGNFVGWVQYRKMIRGESDMLNPTRSSEGKPNVP